MESSPSNDSFMQDALKTLRGVRFNNDYLKKMQSSKRSEYKFLERENLQLQQEVSILSFNNTNLKQNAQKIQNVLHAFVSQALHIPIQDSVRVVEEMLMEQKETVPAPTNLPLPRRKPTHVPRKKPMPTIREEVNTYKPKGSMIPVSTRYARRGTRTNI